MSDLPETTDAVDPIETETEAVETTESVEGDEPYSPFAALAAQFASDDEALEAGAEEDTDGDDTEEEPEAETQPTATATTTAEDEAPASAETPEERQARFDQYLAERDKKLEERLRAEFEEKYGKPAAKEEKAPEKDAIRLKAEKFAEANGEDPDLVERYMRLAREATSDEIEEIKGASSEAKAATEWKAAFTQFRSEVGDEDAQMVLAPVQHGGRETRAIDFAYDVMSKALTPDFDRKAKLYVGRAFLKGIQALEQAAAEAKKGQDAQATRQTNQKIADRQKPARTQTRQSVTESSTSVTERSPFSLEDIEEMLANQR